MEDKYSEIAEEIQACLEEHNDVPLNKKVYLHTSVGTYDGKIFPLCSRFIKIWQEEKKGIRFDCFKVLTNYTFRISKIIINRDDEQGDKKDLELEVTDMYGNNFKFNLQADSKHSLSSFRKSLYPLGNLVDYLNNAEFSQIFMQLYEDITTEQVHVFKRPGLIEAEGVWLFDNAVIPVGRKGEDDEE